jgi:nonsense-mediated mRNA decay protein 3
MLPRKQDQERLERDFELFLRDVEEDEELRHTMQVYKAQQEAAANEMEMETDDEDDDEGPSIPMDQLLDEFEEMNMQDAA